MIINVLSTPRTGSVYYSFYLKSLYPDSFHSEEFFNRYHMGLYHKIVDGKRLNLREYEEGSFYVDYFVENNILTHKRVFDKRTRYTEGEENYRISLFDQIPKTQTMILHNHVWPISDKVLTTLIEIGNKNYYIYRKDKRAQLGSYAIAMSTKQFVKFNDGNESGIVNDIEIDLLKQMIFRIEVWDDIVNKINDNKSIIVAYEDIQFTDEPGFPKKQNLDYTTRLSEKMLDTINSLVTEYENKSMY